MKKSTPHNFRTTRRRATRRGVTRRGVALVLVLLMLGITVVLGAVFLNAASTTAPLARSADERYKARLIAEAGVELASAHVQRNDNWRATLPNGLWLENHPLN